MRTLLIAGLVFMAPAAHAQIAGVGGGACSFDEAALLSMPYDAFDQDPNAGWRPLAQAPGCERAAAGLLEAYRRANADQLKPDQISLLNWHQAQVHASAGEYELAIPLFETAGPNEKTGEFSEAFGLYREATVAFLRRDRQSLILTRGRLAALQEPEWFAAMAKDSQEKFGFRPAWPMNLDVVDGLLACFDLPYFEAYGAQCRSGSLR